MRTFGLLLAFAPAGPHMHFHLPKPMHGWREFVGEVGIIVVGVLIALGAEQVVEWVHDNNLQREARETIGAEIGQNLDSFRRRSEVQHCIDNRLRKIEELILAPQSSVALPRPLWVGRPQVWTVTDSRWNAATSGVRTALLSASQQAQYGDVYDGLKTFDGAQAIEQIAWAHLRVLETLPSIDPLSRSSLVQALHEARYANFRIKVAAVQTQERARAAALLVGHSPYSEGSRSVCIPMNTARDVALRMTVPLRCGPGARTFPDAHNGSLCASI